MSSMKDVTDRIQTNGLLVRSAATELTNRIKTFEGWLSKRPGRVEVHVPVSCSADGQEHEMLAFRPNGKDWSLVTYTDLPFPDHVPDEQLLRDAPIEIKARMIEEFPKLLAAFADRQAQMVERAKEATKDFDAMAKEFGIKEGA